MPDRIIDAHHHLWKLADGDYGWLKGMPELVHDFTAKDFLPLMQEAGIDRSIIVQAIETEAETVAMLAWAEAHDWIAGVIGWVDLAATDAPERLDWLAAQPHAVGLRNWAMTRPDPAWLARPDLDTGFAALAATRLAYDALVNPSNLMALIARVERTPGLRVCINHFAYPNLGWANGGPELRAWTDNLKALAGAGCTIKLSGFGHKVAGRWQPELFQGFVDTVIDIFGPARTIWASNWPTVLIECSLLDWYNASRAWTASLTIDESNDIFSAAAQRFYRLQEFSSSDV